MALNLLRDHLIERIGPLQNEIQEGMREPERNIALLTELRIERDRLLDYIIGLAREEQARVDRLMLAREEHRYFGVAEAARLEQAQFVENQLQARLAQVPEPPPRPRENAGIRMQIRDQSGTVSCTYAYMYMICLEIK